MNLKVRFLNPAFYFSLFLAIVTPILGYAGITMADLTTWESVLNLLKMAISNPYVLGLIVVSVYNALVDFTSKGITDSALAKTYTKPNSDK